MKSLFAIVVVLLCAGQGEAQSFEQFLERGRVLSQQARRTLADKPSVVAQRQAAVFAKVIVCFAGRARFGLPDFLRLYTRLEGVHSLAALPAVGHGLPVWDGTEPKADESAALLVDYRGASISRKSFRYGSWSCDTTDYWLNFDTELLMRRLPSEASHPVAGHLLIETRGQTDWEGDLPCVAYFR